MSVGPVSNWPNLAPRKEARCWNERVVWPPSICQSCCLHALLAIELLSSAEARDHELADRFHATGETFTSRDYLAKTPHWAVHVSKIGAGFDDGGPFAEGYEPRRNQCKMRTNNETFALIELSKA